MCVYGRLGVKFYLYDQKSYTLPKQAVSSLIMAFIHSCRKFLPPMLPTSQSYCSTSELGLRVWEAYKDYPTWCPKEYWVIDLQI